MTGLGKTLPIVLLSMIFASPVSAIEPCGDISDKTLVTWVRPANLDQQHRFVQDIRWYKPQGRWDCIDTVQRADGGLYAYFTADPVRDKVSYACCGFGMAVLFTCLATVLAGSAVGRLTRPNESERMRDRAERIGFS